ncbi:MAG: NAD(P)-dependent alcohol dehydrogenase, partial [Pseudolysinimonas sp.]
MRDTWGGVEAVRVLEVSVPEPGPSQVLVSVRASSVNALDWHQLEGLPYLIRLAGGLRRPKDRFLGADVAGVVEAVGSEVTRFSPGDEVMGQSIRTFADFVVVSEAGLVRKPANVSFVDAAAVPLAGLTALQMLRAAGIRGGVDVLVSGAGGGVGSLAVQLASALGAASVAATTRTDALEFVRSLGAGEVFDYSTDELAALDARFDVIADASGALDTRTIRRLLRPGGVAAIAGLKPGSGQLFCPIIQMLGPVPRHQKGTTIVRVSTVRTTEDLQTLADLLESGKL